MSLEAVAIEAFAAHPIDVGDVFEFLILVELLTTTTERLNTTPYRRQYISPTVVL